MTKTIEELVVFLDAAIDNYERDIEVIEIRIASDENSITSFNGKISMAKTMLNNIRPEVI